MGDNQDKGVPPPTPKCHKWLEEIETDVLRTCPDDESAVKDAAAEFDTAISQRNVAAAARERDAAETGDSSPSDAGGPTTGGVRFAIPDTSRGSSDDDLSGAVELSPVAAGEGSARKEGEAVPSEATVATNPRSGAEVLSGPGGGGERAKRMLSVTGGGTRDKLRRVLRAFAVYNRRVSYCQVHYSTALCGSYRL